MVADLANSLGDHVDKDANTPGGATFEMHWNNPTNYNKIQSQAWDYVVFQGQSQEPSFPDNQVNTQTLPYVMMLADSVYDNNFCTEVMYYMTWGRENGDPQWQPISTYEGMQSRLRSAYLRFADSVQGSVSPVGAVWQYVRNNHPTIDLYTADESHPSLQGSYLAACTFYTSIFRKPCTGATYNMGIDPTIAGQIQAAADLVVLDSLDNWNLRDPSVHTRADFSYNSLGNGTVDFTNESTKGQTFFWDFGDGNTSTEENPSHTYAADGQYTVTLTVTSECNTDDEVQQVQVTIASINELGNSQVALLNLGNFQYEIQTEVEVSQLILLDAAGNLVQKSNEKAFDLSQLPSGLYLIRIHSDQGAASFKIVK